MQLFLGILNEQLRFFTSEGALVPTPEEAEIQERQRADQAEAQAAIFLRKLQELGIDPADL